MTGWPQNAYVGQKIVCVAEDWQDPDTGADCDVSAPKLREVVTILRIYRFRGHPCFIVCEYPRGGFSASGFRPVKDTSPAVEELKRIALKPSLPAGEPVA